MQAGDKVIVWSRNNWMVRDILKVTPTQILMFDDTDPTRFKKSDGREIGASVYYYSSIEVYTDEKFNELEQSRIENAKRNLLKHHNFYNLTDETMNELYNFLLNKQLIKPIE